ncbi:MAG: hypothetical protein IIV48_05145 [Clostridium sp.]|nr:hypothetical protein [Clostridium sp.]
MKKKQGVVMLEVLLLLNVLLVLIVCNSKIITNNLSKIQLYQIKEDILTLNDLEYEILKEVQELAKNDDEIAQVIKNHKEDLSIKYQYNFSGNENLKFIIENGNIYLKQIFEGNIESIREIKMILIKNGEEEEVIFKPELYKVLYMV